MPRAPRLEYPGAFYHVISRGNRQQPIFHRKVDHQRFLDILYAAVKRYDFRLYAYVLMPNHFHLLLEQGDCLLSRLMQVMLTSYARWHNHRYRQSGHLFQGRYRAILCDKESYLLELTRYIHLNPVRARIVKDPRDYLWSSYLAYLGIGGGKEPETGLVLGMLHKRKAAARLAYERFVLGALGEGRKPDLYAAKEQLFLGDDRFVEESKRCSQRVARIEIRPSRRPPMQKIMEWVSRHTGIALPLLGGRTEGEAEKRAREIVAGLARDCFGLRLAEVAVALRRKPNTISVLAKKLTEHIQREEMARKLLERAVKSII